MGNLIDNFLSAQADRFAAYAENETATFGSSSFPVIYDQRRRESRLAGGGFDEGGDRCVVKVRVSQLPTTPPDEGDKITLKAETWRIEALDRGNTYHTYELVNANRRRD